MSFRVVAGWIAVVLAAGSARALTADELIAKHIEARGGLDRLKAIQSLRLVGTRSRAGGGLEQTWVEIFKRPGSLRLEITMQGLTMIRAGDAGEGWTVQPFRGRKDPEKLPADALKELGYEADLDGPLVDSRAKGIAIDYLGTEDVDGTEAHKLKVTRPTGDVDYVYLDPDYYLEIRRVTQHRVRGTLVEGETDFGNYERVAGVYFPFSIESGAKGASEKDQKVNIAKAEANVAVDDAIFRFPK